MSERSRLEWVRCALCDSLRPAEWLKRSAEKSWVCLDARVCGRLRATRPFKGLEKFLVVSEARTRGISGVGK